MQFLITKLKKIFLLGGDLIVLYFSLWLTLNLRYQFYVAPGLWNQHFIAFSIIYFIWLIIFYISGLYDLNLARSNHLFYAALFKILLIAAAVSIGFFYLIPFVDIAPKTNLFLNLTIFTALFIAWRYFFNYFIKSPSFLSNLLIIGKTKETDELVRYLKENPQLGYFPKKYVDHQEVHLIFDLIENLIKENIQMVAATINPQKNHTLIKNLYQCLPLKITFIDLATFYEKITGRIPISIIEEIWFLENLMAAEKGIYDGLKRAFDIIGSLILGVIILPILPLIALAIKLDNPGHIFYKQKRVGQDGKIFTLFKFRSMFESAEKNGAQWTLPNDKRITKVGDFLRKTRLDELPQLWNILRGDMSFVGPRPERPEIALGQNLPEYIPFYQIRHLIRPGLTGWAQINFHYGASIEDAFEKLQYDLYYLKNRSFTLDLATALKTIKIILSREGR